MLLLHAHSGSHRRRIHQRIELDQRRGRQHPRVDGYVRHGKEIQRRRQPIFERLTKLQWVNAGFAAAFGWGAANDFSSPEQLEKLSRKTVDTAEMRHVIANQFRVFERDAWSPVPWPWRLRLAMKSLQA